MTLPGGDTTDFKTKTIVDLIGQRLRVGVGVGNRATDITAHANAGIAAAQTFIKLPEYQSEVQSALDAGQAIGFATYAALDFGP